MNISGDTDRLLFRLIKSPASALGIDGMQKIVLLNFVDALDPARNGTLSWPGAETIAERFDLHEKTVRRAINRLCAADLMKLHRRTGRKVIYAVNVGLINRLIEAGLKVRSEKPDGTQSPVRPDRESGQLGLKVRSDRTQSPAKYQGSTNEVPTEEPTLSTVGPSASLKEQEDPVQRRLALHGLVRNAADDLRSPCQEGPTEEKAKAARDSALELAAGLRRRLDGSG